MKNDELIEHHLIHTGRLDWCPECYPARRDRGGCGDDYVDRNVGAAKEGITSTIAPGVWSHQARRVGRNFLPNEGNKEIGNQGKMQKSRVRPNAFQYGKDGLCLRPNGNKPWMPNNADFATVGTQGRKNRAW